MTAAIALADTLAETAPPIPGDYALPRGTLLGRYVVLSRLGGGGMGVVFQAFDPELDRRVALKLLRSELATSGASSDARARLIREAQALARLSHPNIVAVHDVGVVGEHVFVAMEFVAGMTLTRWVAEQPRSWREIVRTFTSAGRGLEAAHEAGILHRDFKPDNVIVGHDDRVRVIDFGLARSDGHDTANATTRPFDARLTLTGALMGTPAYMAPEQFHGDVVDARTDQFSFCVALYEALYGERPFPGTTLVHLASAVTAGELREPSRGTKVPAWLRRVLLRGLSVDPEARYASMRELLAALGREPGRGVRRALPLVLAASAVVAGIAYQHSQTEPADEVCVGAARKLAPMWPARAPAILSAFTRTNVPYANDSFRSLYRIYDGYASAWTAMHTEACRATAIRHEQSPELLDLRMTCLQRRAAELDAQTDLMSHADAATVAKAVSAASSLPSIEDCANLDMLRTVVPLAADPIHRGRIAVVRADIARVRSLLAAGQYSNGLDLARQTTQESEALDYPPLLTEALALRGKLENQTGDLVAAESTLRAGELQAIAARDEAALADVWATLIEVVGTKAGKLAEAENWMQHATAIEPRVADRSRAQIAEARGALLRARGKYDDAVAEHRKALAIYERLGDTAQTDVATSLYNLANTYYLQGKYADADAAYMRSLVMREQLLGPTHPEVARVLTNIGTSLRMQARYEEALARQREALAIRVSALGPEHADVGTSHNNIGAVLEKLERPAEAADEYRQAIAIYRKALGPDHPNVAAVLDNLGNVDSTLGHDEEALAHHREALAMREARLGPDHPDVGLSLNNLGEALYGLHRHDEALAAYRRGLAIVTAKLGPKHLYAGVLSGNIGRVLEAKGNHRESLVAYRNAYAIAEAALGAKHESLGYSLTGIGIALLGLHDASQAVPVLERASALREKSDPTERATTLFALARAVYEASHDHKRAGALAEQARVALAPVRTTAARRDLAAIEHFIRRVEELPRRGPAS